MTVSEAKRMASMLEAQVMAVVDSYSDPSDKVHILSGLITRLEVTLKENDSKWNQWLEDRS
jgi:hypothetical protein